MNRYQSYLILLGFITEKSENKDKEWLLTEALENLYNSEDETKECVRKPLITKDILDDMK